MTKSEKGSDNNLTRLNKYVAQAAGISRRAADELIQDGRIHINGKVATIGDKVQSDDHVALKGQPLKPLPYKYIVLNKPTGYVCSQRQQGDTPTIYSLLPPALHNLQVAGRLDSDSSGLVLLTNDGDFALQLTHPRFAKKKSYSILLNMPLTVDHQKSIEQGVVLDDGKSALQLDGEGAKWNITMHEGRNRQIRRTFESLGYKVAKLHRETLGPYKLDKLQSSEYDSIDKII